MTDLRGLRRTAGIAWMAVSLLFLPGLAGAQRVDYRINVPMDVSGLDPRAEYVEVSCEPDGVDTFMGERYRPSADLDENGSFKGVLLFQHGLPNPADSANLTTYRCHWFICDRDALGCAYPEPGGSGFNAVSANPPPVLEYRGSFH